jgi:hypothetical protein
MCGIGDLDVVYNHTANGTSFNALVLIIITATCPTAVSRTVRDAATILQRSTDGPQMHYRYAEILDERVRR